MSHLKSKRRFLAALVAVFPSVVVAKFKAPSPEPKPRASELITGSEGHVRALDIRVENADIGDGWFSREVADALDGYARSIKDGYNGNSSKERYTYVSKRNSVTVVEVTARNYYQGKELP